MFSTSNFPEVELSQAAQKAQHLRERLQWAYKGDGLPGKSSSSLEDLTLNSGLLEVLDANLRQSNLSDSDLAGWLKQVEEDRQSI